MRATLVRVKEGGIVSVILAVVRAEGCVHCQSLHGHYLLANLLPRELVRILFKSICQGHFD